MKKVIDGYFIPGDIELEDGHGEPTFETFTFYKKGDKITLNYKHIELIVSRSKAGKLHTFEAPLFYNKKPCGEMLRRFNNGEIATVVRNVRGSVVFQFSDGFESCQRTKWLKRLKKCRKPKK